MSWSFEISDRDDEIASSVVKEIHIRIPDSTQEMRCILVQSDNSKEEAFKLKAVKFKRIEYVILFNLVLKKIESDKSIDNKSWRQLINECNEYCKDLATLNNYIEQSLPGINKLTVFPPIIPFIPGSIQTSRLTISKSVVSDAKPVPVHPALVSTAVVNQPSMLVTATLALQRTHVAPTRTTEKNADSKAAKQTTPFVFIKDEPDSVPFPEWSILTPSQKSVLTQVMDNQIEIDNNGDPEKCELSKLIRNLANPFFILNRREQKQRRTLALIEILVCLGECHKVFGDLLEGKQVSDDFARIREKHSELEKTLMSAILTNKELELEIRSILISQSANHPYMKDYVDGLLKVKSILRPNKIHADFKLWSLDALKDMKDDEYATCEITDAEYITHHVVTKKGKLKREEGIEFSVTTSGEKKILKAQKKNISRIMEVLRADVIVPSAKFMVASPPEVDSNLRSDGVKLMAAVQHELRRNHLHEFGSGEMKYWEKMLNDNIYDKDGVLLKKISIKYSYGIKLLSGIVDFLKHIANRSLVYVELFGESPNLDRDKFLYKEIAIVFFKCFENSHKLFSLPHIESQNVDVNAVVNKFNEIAKLLVEIDKKPDAKALGFKLADLKLDIKPATLNAFYLHVAPPEVRRDMFQNMFKM